MAQADSQVLAWRPLPADVKEADLGGQSLWTADLPREYLVKFVDRGFRHVRSISAIMYASN